MERISPLGWFVTHIVAPSIFEDLLTRKLEADVYLKERSESRAEKNEMVTG